METIETILLKGVRLDKDEDIEITTKRGSKFLATATIDFKYSLGCREFIILKKVDGLNSSWDEITLELKEIESIRIIQP